MLHNLGQIGVAWLILKTQALVYYLPFLLFSAVAGGVVIGIAAAVVIKRIDGDGYGD